MTNIAVEPDKVWTYFKENIENFSTDMRVIARNPSYGIEICITKAAGEFPTIFVLADDEEIDEETCVSQNDCTITVKKFYDKYLSDNIVNALMSDDDSLTEEEESDKIDDRELELDDALYEFLQTLIPNLFDVINDVDELCDDLKDSICEYLYKKYGISVYRPMFLECEDGTEEFTEYPYPEME